MAKQSLEEKFAGFMRGRYGNDELGNVCMAIALPLVLVNIFVNSVWLSLVALVPILYSCFRLSSRNIAARRAENRAFLKALGPAANWVSRPKATFAELRNYKHLTCPSCGKRMRVPRGKGKMRVTCPSCGDKFETRS